MQALSVVIISLNEEAHIAQCIRSVKGLADEIILLDSGSSDRTVEIARCHGVRVFQEAFRGYIEQKNRVLQLASHHFVLSLDADEALSAELTTSIRNVKKYSTCDACSMNRRTYFNGRFLRHGLWYPDTKVRLFDRRLAKWGGMNPHDTVILSPNMRVLHLRGDILHHPFDTIEELVTRNNNISTIAAQSLWKKGKRSSWYKLLVHPSWTFFHGYLLRRGFLDGAQGFGFAVHSAYQVFLKYSKLYSLQRAAPVSQARGLVKTILPDSKSIAGEN